MKDSTNNKRVIAPLLYMKKRLFPVVLLCISMLASIVPAQGQAKPMPEPQQEKLLNGLKVLVWNDAKSDKVTLKLRVHAGAMFDPKDKMGTMKLLSDILFPDEQTRVYFQEDLEGKLEVIANYDYIQITATGKADEFINILDNIRVGVVNTPITQENFVKVRDAHLQGIKDELAKPAVRADLSVAKQLLGEFPYGRPAGGTPESIAKIDRFDLVTSKEKFLDADNATLAIYGKVDPRFAIRAARQMLGNWQKSDGIVPATFAQPEAPLSKIVIVDAPGEANAEVRFAVRGLASNDKDAPALIFWLTPFEKKLNSQLPGDCQGVKVQHWSHILPGALLVSGSYPAENASKCFNAIKTALGKAETGKIDPAEFTGSKDSIYGMVANRTDDLDHVSNLWLNADTFKWGKVTDQLRLMNAAAPADADRAAARVFGKAPIAAVILGDAGKIKGQFAAADLALSAAEEIALRKEVTDFLVAWRTAMEKRDTEAIMKLYAPRLEAFYADKDKDSSYVRAEREKLFAQYDTVRINMNKITYVPDSPTAVNIVLERSWSFAGKEQTFGGAAEQQFKLVKTNGQWQIVSEQDLQTFASETKKVAKPAETPAKP